MSNDHPIDPLLESIDSRCQRITLERLEQGGQIKGTMVILQPRNIVMIVDVVMQFSAFGVHYEIVNKAVPIAGRLLGNRLQDGMASPFVFGSQRCSCGKSGWNLQCVTVEYYDGLYAQATAIAEGLQRVVRKHAEQFCGDGSHWQSG